MDVTQHPVCVPPPPQAPPQARNRSFSLKQRPNDVLEKPMLKKFVLLSVDNAAVFSKAFRSLLPVKVSFHSKNFAEVQTWSEMPTDMKTEQNGSI